MTNDLVPFSFKTLAAVPGKSKNDVFYSKQVLADSVPKWLGRPFIMDHDTYCSEKVYGILNKATYGVDVVSSGQAKEGLWLSGVGKMPKSLFRRIKASKNIPSLISHVSIGGTGEGIFEPTQITLMSFEPQELSITAFPGIPDAEIVQIDQIRESYSRSSKGDMKMSDSKIVEVPLEQAEAEAAKTKTTVHANATTTTVSSNAPITLTVPTNSTSTAVVAVESQQVRIKEDEDEDVCPKCGAKLNADGECGNCGYGSNDSSAKPAKTNEQSSEDEDEDEGEDEDEDETGTPGPLAGSGSLVGNKVPGVIQPKVPAGSVKGAGERAPQVQHVTLGQPPITTEAPSTLTAPTTLPAQVPIKTQSAVAGGTVPFDLSTTASNINQRVKELYTKYLNETHDTREAMRRAWIAAQSEILEPGYVPQ